MHSSLIRLLTLVLTLCWGLALGQIEYQLSLVGEISFANSTAGCPPWSQGATGGSDIWGYTAEDGSEYAIMGVYEGIAVVEVPTLDVVDVIPGPQGGGDCWWHRDIKTYGHYAYAVAEMTGTNQGLMIMDLQYLPDSVRFVGSYVTGSEIRSHNFSIDTATGYAYICNNAGNGFRVVSLEDPENPVDVANIFTGQCHDVYARNDTVYVAEGSTGDFTIWDATDKENPELIHTIDVPSPGYCHNIWPTDDGKYVMTTEETSGKTMKVWDISNIGNNESELVGEYLAANDLAHNTQVMGNLAFVSHYSAGVIVVDLTDPTNPEEVASYDTYIDNDDSGFWGCWGAYPYTESGYVYASDFRGHLTVLQFEELITGIDTDEPQSPQEFLLAQNYPNPFNPATTISLQLPIATQTQLAIFDVNGRKIRELANTMLGSGTHEFLWDGSDDGGVQVASGVYIYRMTTNEGFNQTRKMMLVR